MTARAEGLWWVRKDLGSGEAPWRGVMVVGEKVYIPGWARPLDVDDEFIEWGPYLGKEPGDGERIVHKMTRDHAQRIKAMEDAIAGLEEPDADPYPERNSDENRLIHGVPDGWDLVWWKSIKVGDTVRFGRHLRYPLRPEKCEGVVDRVDIPGSVISFGGTAVDPRVDTMAWQRRSDAETVAPTTPSSGPDSR
jgi:hypothetical protein